MRSASYPFAGSTSLPPPSRYTQPLAVDGAHTCRGFAAQSIPHHHTGIVKLHTTTTSSSFLSVALRCVFVGVRSGSPLQGSSSPPATAPSMATCCGSAQLEEYARFEVRTPCLACCQHTRTMSTLQHTGHHSALFTSPHRADAPASLVECVVQQSTLLHVYELVASRVFVCVSIFDECEVAQQHLQVRNHSITAHMCGLLCILPHRQPVPLVRLGRHVCMCALFDVSLVAVAHV